MPVTARTTTVVATHIHGDKTSRSIFLQLKKHKILLSGTQMWILNLEQGICTKNEKAIRHKPYQLTQTQTNTTTKSTTVTLSHQLKYPIPLTVCPLLIGVQTTLRGYSSVSQASSLLNSTWVYWEGVSRSTHFRNCCQHTARSSLECTNYQSDEKQCVQEGTIHFYTRSCSIQGQLQFLRLYIISLKLQTTFTPLLSNVRSPMHMMSRKQQALCQTSHSHNNWATTMVIATIQSLLYDGIPGVEEQW